MVSDYLKVGVFDSGVGGLTVVSQIKKYLPNASIVYIGDTARVPWGMRSPGTVIRFAAELVSFLLSRQVSLIVVACHTASAVALPHIIKEVQIPVIGVIKPTIKTILRKTRGKVGIIATPTTIHSGAWEKALKNQNPKLEIVSVSAPLLVPIAEVGDEQAEFTQNIVAKYVKDFKKKKVDTVVLACTHYPLLYPIFRKELPGVNLINPGEETAKYLKYLLEANYARGKDKFFFTDLTDTVRLQVFRLFGRKTNQLKEVKNALTPRKIHGV